MMKQSGYYRYPTIQGNRVVFVCEDDLWGVPLTGGIAMRLTSNLGEVSHPSLSPDGTQLAFVGREEGHPEIYVMPAEGGVSTRLTFLGAHSSVTGWSPDGQSILFTSNSAQPFRWIYKIYQVSSAGGLPEEVPVGLAHSISYGRTGGVVIGRNTSDIARWKRYRGGAVGVIWIDPEATGTFQPLIQLPGNLASPMWVGERIYLISDHEGVGNLYSCTPDGENLQQHTHNREYYIRNATTDGDRIVYHAGANLFCFDPATGENSAIDIQFHSPQVQRQRKFIQAAHYLEDYALHPDGHSTLVTCRGRSFWFGHWEGAVTQIGQPDGVRYRLTRWLNDKKRFVTVADSSGAEAIEIHSSTLESAPERLDELDVGRAVTLEVSPTDDQVLLSNHRHELVIVDLGQKQSRVIDRSDYGRIGGFCWSPDGQWIAYGLPVSHKVCVIKVTHLKDGKIYQVTSPNFWDFAPSFDPDGKYLYFLSYRDFNPVYDSHYFDLNFPRGIRPFLVTLMKDLPSPFIPTPKPLGDKKSDNNSEKPADTAPAPEPAAEGAESTPGEAPESAELKPSPDQDAAIDFDEMLDGIEHRVIGFPVPEGRYRQIWGLKGKVLFSSVPVQGSLDEDEDEDDSEAKIELYDFDKQKRETIATDVNTFKVGWDYETLIYRSGHRLRVCIATQAKNGVEDEPSRKSGWLDLNKIKVSVLPVQEWQQMFREAWRLQKEHFWVEDMSGVDWERVYQRYRPLLDKVSTRSEFSDLIWEMQGELGTSHAYEGGGDYRRQPRYPVGFLGADFAYDAATNGYRVTHIVQGDSWNPNETSPLTRLGQGVQVGDILLAVGGQRVSRDRPPQALLVHQANVEVALTFANPEGEPRTITVQALHSDRTARYREWVERNRRTVLEETEGRVGYVHVPDMGPEGYAEFHRYYGVEAERDGLIVDVRYNGGGNVSQLILEKLSRRRIAYTVSRWGKPESYPRDAVTGPMVAITNEHAGSDGDIFSHCFKLLNLGTLIGKRTWGGVIGIWPRHALVDGGYLTQPEFSFWFKDVGWKVENYGTEPHIEVDIPPQDWVQGFDPQLNRAIALILEEMQQNPVLLPEFGDRPRLTLPN